MQKSIILLSSGLDSVVSATVARRRTAPVLGLTFDYGQRAAKMEIIHARKVSRRLGFPHKVVRLPFFRDLAGGRSLIGRARRVPVDRLLKVEDVWVPNRNALFINIAAAYAEHLKARLIVTGFNRQEAIDFPDNTSAFVAAVNRSLYYSTRRRVKAVSYVLELNKKEIYRLGRQIGAPLEYVYSCYLGGRRMCGKCSSCRFLLAAQGRKCDPIRSN